MTEITQETAPIVRSVEIHATAERVFALLTEPDELVRWWPDAATLEARVGGRVHLVFEGRGEATGEVTSFEPPRALGFTWTVPEAGVTTRVDFTVEDRGDGTCRVEVVHTGFEKAPELRTRFDEGWAYYLGRLVAAAEGRPVE